MNLTSFGTLATAASGIARRIFGCFHATQASFDRSLTGGTPKHFLYSRLNCEALA